jgi:hypothetical protein
MGEGGGDEEVKGILSRLVWVLESAENFPCHQCMSVSHLYAKTSGRTWRIGGSQIWVRTGRDSILCRVCWTLTQKCSRSVTTSTSPNPSKTMPSVIFQWTWKVFTCILLRKKWKTWMDKSSITAIWTNSWVWVPHPWISTWPLSKGNPRFNRTCKSNRWPTTQTLWCGGSIISKSFRTWSEWLDSTWQYLLLLCTDWLVREVSGHHHDWPDVG